MAGSERRDLARSFEGIPLHHRIQRRHPEIGHIIGRVGDAHELARHSPSCLLGALASGCWIVGGNEQVPGDRQRPTERLRIGTRFRCLPLGFPGPCLPNAILCASIPEEYGGAGGNFLHEKIIIEEQARAGASGFGVTLHNGIVAPYIYHYGSEEQRQRWLPRMATGELVTAIAMTEPGTGSDLQSVRTTAKRQGNQYSISGAKTFITNGQTANLH